MWWGYRYYLAITILGKIEWYFCKNACLNQSKSLYAFCDYEYDRKLKIFNLLNLNNAT